MNVDGRASLAWSEAATSGQAVAAALEAAAAAPGRIVD